ncbi:MAG: ABC transporter ATP-binding protein [Peptostreptococcaceae bacterium]
MLKIENLNKDLVRFKLNNINLELPEGFIMGLIGTNGSGKTTLMKLIMDLMDYDSGDIKIFGKSMKDSPEEIKNKIGFVYDSLNFYPHLSVKDFKNISKSFYKDFEMAKFDEYLTKFDINQKLKIKNLSKGQSAKLMLANALSHKAKLLILDEPTAGLDPIVRKEVINHLQEFIEEENTSVLICTHNTDELDRIADYITLVNKGEVIFSQDKESLKEGYRVVRGSKENIEVLENIVGINHQKYYSEALVRINSKIEYLKVSDCIKEENIKIPTVEDFMYYYTASSKK